MKLFKRDPVQVWKLQRPLVSSAGLHQVLAYTENKEQTAFIDMDQELMDELFEDEPKVYVLASVVKGNLSVKEILEEQDW